MPGGTQLSSLSEPALGLPILSPQNNRLNRPSDLRLEQFLTQAQDGKLIVSHSRCDDQEVALTAFARYVLLRESRFLSACQGETVSGNNCVLSRTKCPMQHDSQTRGLLTSYVYPSLLLFAIPVFSLWFFHHAKVTFDGRILAATLKTVQQDPLLSPEERDQAASFFRRFPTSQVLESDSPELQQLRDSVPDETRFHYSTFRWMLRLSLCCIVAGLAVYAGTGISLAVSIHYSRLQYISLLAGWHVLRWFSTFQVLAQAGLIFALSYWITGLWFGFYSVEVMAVVGLVALGSALPSLAAILEPVRLDCEVAGQELNLESSPVLWEDLRRLSVELETSMPDQIIAGIDDNFFVTELPLKVNDKTVTGRTLYVSLSLLRHLLWREADAVLIHELSHFSGNDTHFGRKISPLLVRYQHFLEGLQSGVLSRPVHCCAVAFRILYEVSLGKASRQCEFRADRIAAQKTSADSMAGALLRIAAYGAYRGSVETDLLETSSPYETANIAQRIDSGFRDFAAGFAERNDLAEQDIAHPFNSHPPLGQRLAAIGFESTADAVRQILAAPADGIWLRKIIGAEQLERSLWSHYEERFQQFHDNVLAFRYLPATDEEREVVERHFPQLTLLAYKQQPVTLDCEKITFGTWDTPVYYGEIENITAETEWGRPRLNLILNRTEGCVCQLPLSKKKADQRQLMTVLQHYWGRYTAAAAYQAGQQQADAGIPPDHPG